MFGAQELILILLIVVIVFGAKRIPEIMGGLGQGIKSFKKALDEEPEANTSPNSPQSPQNNSPKT